MPAGCQGLCGVLNSRGKGNVAPGAESRAKAGNAPGKGHYTGASTCRGGVTLTPLPPLHLSFLASELGTATPPLPGAWPRKANSTQQAFPRRAACAQEDAAGPAPQSRTQRRQGRHGLGVTRKSSAANNPGNRTHAPPVPSQSRAGAFGSGLGRLALIDRQADPSAGSTPRVSGGEVVNWAQPRPGAGSLPPWLL